MRNRTMQIGTGALACCLILFSAGCKTVEESDGNNKNVVMRKPPMADIPTRRPKKHVPRRPTFVIIEPESSSATTQGQDPRTHVPGVARTDDRVVPTHAQPRHPSEVMTSGADETLDHVVRTNIPTERVPTTSVVTPPGE